MEFNPEGVVEMTTEIEVERRFIVKFGLDLLLLEEQSKKITEITQHYFGKMRLRKSAEKGSVPAFYLTLKQPTGNKGECSEENKEVSEEEYENLLKKHVSELATLQKVRYQLDFEGNTFEVDVFMGTLLIIVEVELDHIDDRVALPKEWELQEITGDHEWSNKRLAEKLSGRTIH